VSLPRSSKALAAILGGSGVIHLVKPDVYKPLMPAWVPAHREVILASGVAELALAAGLALPRTRRLAGWGSVALLLGVYPGNIKMTVDAAKRGHKPMLVASVARLPLQVPMIKAALDATRA
jgi:uncharacterized membrane protein